MKKKELSILIAGGLAASFMLNNVQAVNAQERNPYSANESVKESNVSTDLSSGNSSQDESVKEKQADDTDTTNQNSDVSNDHLNAQTTEASNSEEEAKSDFVYLSDIDYDASQSKVGYGKINKDTNIEGGTITLIVDGQAVQFDKGIGAHATSTVVYDLRNYKQYSRFISYVGIDKSKGNYGNGVKFSIYTSDDGKSWTLAKDIGLLKANNECAYVDIDISNANYLKLYANDNGYNGYDHAVYGGAMLAGENYGGNPISSDVLKPVSEYDETLKQSTIEENMAQNEFTILRRDFVNKVGYDNLKRLAAQNEDYKNAIQYLLENEDALRYFVAGGPENINGSYTSSVKFFSDIFVKYSDEIKSGADNDFNLRMAISIALADGNLNLVRFWLGTPTDTNAVNRYEIYKELISSGKMDEGGNTEGDGKWSSEQFKALPVPLMRWVMSNRIHDDEIMWLADYALDQKSKGKNYLSAYNYITYTSGYNYNNPSLYDPSNYDKYNEKYHFGDYFSDYGTKDKYRLWMVFEEGSVCGGLAKTYSNLATTFGRPSSVVGQPGHAATITYAWNKANNRYEYIIQNNIFGWAQSGNEYSDRLLRWGNESWSKNHSASYAVLATDAINDYDNFVKANELNILADIYDDNNTKKEAYLKALDYQKINVDSMEGLINTYKADSNATSTDYLDLSKKIINTYTYYPQAMVELLSLVKDNVTDSNEIVRLDVLQNNALIKASKATPAESTCVTMTQQLANSYLGTVSTELADFSFDGENAGKIVINPKYDGSQIRIKYSLDGGSTWTETEDHVITLTDDQIKSINSTNDIKVGLVGIDDIYTIDIIDNKPVTNNNIYKNDLENLLLGETDNLQFSLDGGNTWCDYIGGLENGIRITGNKTVKVRYKAHGHYLQGNSVDYTFTEDTNTPEKTYVQLKNVKLVEYPSQQDNSTHAATNFIDGNYNTGWHTTFRHKELDKFYTVSFDKVRNITSLEYAASGGYNGMIKDADVYTSLDGENWVKSGSVKNLARNYTTKTINLDKPTECKYLKLVATETYGNTNGEINMYLSGRMLNFFENTEDTNVSTDNLSQNNEDLVDNEESSEASVSENTSSNDGDKTSDTSSVEAVSINKDETGANVTLDISSNEDKLSDVNNTAQGTSDNEDKTSDTSLVEDASINKVESSDSNTSQDELSNDDKSNDVNESQNSSSDNNVSATTSTSNSKEETKESSSSGLNFIENIFKSISQGIMKIFK